MDFQDPLTRYSSLEGYLFNIQMLKLLFRPKFILHMAEPSPTKPWTVTTRCKPQWHARFSSPIFKFARNKGGPSVVTVVPRQQPVFIIVRVSVAHSPGRDYGNAVPISPARPCMATSPLVHGNFRVWYRPYHEEDLLPCGLLGRH